LTKFIIITSRYCYRASHPPSNHLQQAVRPFVWANMPPAPGISVLNSDLDIMSEVIA